MSEIEQQEQIVEEKKPITWDDIDSWDYPTMAKKMEDPAIKSEVEEVVRQGRPDKKAIAEAAAKAEEDAEAASAAQEAEDERVRQEQLDNEAAAAKAAEDKAASDAVEAARLAEEAAKPKKIVVEYQARDEAGAPIGRPTHLEAATWEEMSEKQKTAHIEATRALDRLKKKKDTATFKKEEVAPAEMSEAEVIAVAQQLQSDDPDIALAAQRKIDANAIIKDRLLARKEREDARQERESFIFMKRHITDFNPCDANGVILSQYIKENNLEWTADNLEIAFAATESQLASVPLPEAPAPVVPVPVPPVANPTVPVPPAEATVVPAVQAAPPAAAPNAPAAPVRRVPNGGIVPGETLTGRTSVPKPSGLTMKDIAKWDGATMRKEMESSPKRRAEIMRVVKDHEAAKLAKQMSS